MLELRKTLPTFGSRRLIREFDLRLGHNALDRIWHRYGLMEKRRRKYQRRQGLAHIKAQWALFQQISADTKDLDDIPRSPLELCLLPPVFLDCFLNDAGGYDLPGHP